MRRRGGTAERERKRGFFRRHAHAPRGIEARVRIDRRTKDLLQRLKPGEIAIILHEDLDQLAAEGIVERGAAAVINCHRSITGRYPNAGPLVLSRARVPLIDEAGEDLLEYLEEGDTVRIEGASIFREADLIGSGVLLEGELLERALDQAKNAMGAELERFVRNTMEYLQTERDLVLRGAEIPEVETQFTGRHAVVVVRGHHFREDLHTLRGYITDMRPVLVAVDGAADALIEAGLHPDVIIGDMDSVSSEALTCGAEIVVHAYPNGHAPGLDRVEALGARAHVWASAGTSEDIALLLAYEKGADLIVAVGAHDNMVEFLDKGRAGMASTFVTRLKVGPKLVDAKGVSRLYRQLIRTRDLVLLVASAAFVMATAAYVLPGGRILIRLTVDWFKDTLNRIL